MLGVVFCFWPYQYVRYNTLVRGQKLVCVVGRGL